MAVVEVPASRAPLESEQFFFVPFGRRRRRLFFSPFFLIVKELISGGIGKEGGTRIRVVETIVNSRV
jgi:hypothetical protein